MVPTRPEIAALKPYVPGKLEPGKLKLASNENPLGASPRALEALRLAGQSVQLYPEDNAPQLVHALARRHQLEPAWLVAGNGSDEVLQMAAAAFLRPGDEALVAEHTFSVYTAVSLLFGARIKTVPMVDGANDLDAFAAAVGPRTRVVFICSPNNPTGTIVDGDALARFMAALPPQVLVVLDEAYAEFADAPNFQDSRALIRRHANLLVTRTFSKLYGLAGLRVGYGMAQPELAASLQRVRPPFNVNLLAAAAAAAALEDHDFVKRSLETNRAGRRQLEAGIAALGLRFLPTQSNFICIETGRDSLAMYDAICAGGVTIRPLKSFGLPGSIRVTVGTETQNNVFLSALEAALERVPPQA